MSPSSTIEDLRSALDPFAVIHEEHAQIAGWVEQSFAAVEALHESLIQWQLELAEQQEVLDQRLQAAGADEEQAAAMREELETLRREVEQWEADSAEQIEALEELERREAALAVDRDADRQSSAELLAELEAERRRSAIEREVWLTELRELRRVLLERKDDSRLEQRGEREKSSSAGDGDSPTAVCSATSGVAALPGAAAAQTDAATSMRFAALRQRAEKRRQSRSSSQEDL